MKKTAVFFATAIMGAIALGGCGSDDKKNAMGGADEAGGTGNGIVGVWEAQADGQLFGVTEWLFEFRADGIAVQNLTLDFGNGPGLSGSIARYELNGDQISYIGKEVSFGRENNGPWEISESDVENGSDIGFSVSGDILKVLEEGVEVASLRRSAKELTVPQEALDMLGE